MSMFRNVMVMLGLGPDEEYEDSYLGTQDPGAESDGALGHQAQGQGISNSGSRAPSNGLSGDGFSPNEGSGSPQMQFQTSAVGVVRPLQSVPSQPGETSNAGQPIAGGQSKQISSTVRQSSFNQMGSSEGGQTEGSAVRSLGVISSDDQRTVRPAPMRNLKPRVVSPQSFGDAKILADEFKRAVPVVMNLRSVDRDLARRLIDFASGVCYSLAGSMEKLAPQVFLLTPKSVEVSDEDRRRLEERGFDR